MEGPAIAIVRSPREWARLLHRYVADFGGAVVRARPLEERQALDEAYDILIVDDTTSFLTHRLVQQLHREGRRVVGVYDSNDVLGGISVGKERMEQMGVDATIDAVSAPEDFVRLLQTVQPEVVASKEIDQLLAEFQVAEGFRTSADSFAPIGKYGSTSLALDAEEIEEDALLSESKDFELIPVKGPDSTSRKKASNHASRGGKITVVLSASGGAGSTEVAIEMARVIRMRGEVGVLVDADDCSPSVAQRLGLPLHPNIRSAIDAAVHNVGNLANTVISTSGHQASVLVGLPHSKDWVSMRPEEVLAVTEELARVCHHVVVNVAGQLDDLAGIGGIDRFGVARTLIEEADRVIIVAWPTPIGIARLLERIADIQAINDELPVHIVMNRAPINNFNRGEIMEEIQRSFTPQSMHFLPFDKRVEEASWDGDFVVSGPFVDGVLEVIHSSIGARAKIAREPKRRARKAS